MKKRLIVTDLMVQLTEFSSDFIPLSYHLQKKNILYQIYIYIYITGTNLHVIQKNEDNTFNIFLLYFFFRECT